MGREGMKRYKRFKLIIFFILPLLLLPLSEVITASTLQITFLDVGEGEAILLAAPTGERVLIDTGNPMTAYRIVRFLEDRGIKTIDAIFITHPHPDHMGGIFYLLPHFHVKAVYDNGQTIPEKPDCDIYRWYKELREKEGFKTAKAGDIFSYGGIKIKVLWPQGSFSDDWNSNSLVLKVVYDKSSLLFMGDANANVERSLLEAGLDLKADILKVGHHGGDDATTLPFLRAVRPTFAVISVNRGNIRGYPSVEVIRRLNREGVDILITSSHGDIVFRLDGKGGINIK